MKHNGEFEISESDTVSVNVAAEMLGVSPRRVRACIERGWITPHFDERGQKRLSAAHLRRLAYGSTSRKLGFTMSQVRDLFVSTEPFGLPRLDVAQIQLRIDVLLERKKDINTNIDRLKSMMPVSH